jgi:hypothetical protein
LGLVFEHSILDGWTDEQLLQRFPSLFSSLSDLVAAKVQVVETLHSNPTLLQLLHI